MHRTELTKKPSFTQMKRMAENLRKKYGKRASIQVFTYAHESGNVQDCFWMSVEDEFCVRKDTWAGLWISYKYRIRKKA